jgi:hypothetical protein
MRESNLSAALWALYDIFFEEYFACVQTSTENFIWR